MKKFTLPVVVLALVYAVVSCSEPESQDPQQTNSSVRNARETGNDGDGGVDDDQRCYSMRVLADKLREDPGLAGRMADIERQTEAFGLSYRNGGRRPTTPPPPPPVPSTPYDGKVTIPVIVHVIYKTAQQNISQEQIQSQIDVINRDFRKTNSDVSNTPSAFSGLTSDLNVEFTLASVDRKYSATTNWGTSDKMKKLSQGGVNPVDPARNLNIWVCNIGGGILGYAQFPGGSASTDGVVIGPQYFGNRAASGGGAFFLSAPYDLGRTATHEIGHWLNLRHIWGDSNCGNDQVADTPTQQTSNGGCPTFPKVTCSNGPNGDMFMNYMDYTYDGCMYMFTEGQKVRTRALFASNGARRSFVPVP